MRFFKCFFIIFLLFSMFCCSLADDLIEDSESVEINSEPSNVDFEIYSRRAIVFERNSKTVLFGKNVDEKCAMASTTKVMTCTIILENCNLDDIVTISVKSASTGGSRLGLHTNDTMSVRDLLYGLMLCSGNDAAVALAEYCAGSVENFAILMNNKANDLSLQSTHFVTPHGLDNADHYTTVSDFAFLCDYALSNPLFVQIVGTKYYNVSINGSIKSIHNTNELLGTIPSVYGIKTGYTSQAGRCLITSAKQDNLDIIVIVLGADTKSIRTNDSIKLINYVFDNYEAVSFKDLITTKFKEYSDYIISFIEIPKVTSKLSPVLDKNFPEFYPIKKELISSISVVLSEENLATPIYENQKIAAIDIFCENDKIYSTNIYSATYISKKTPLEYLYNFINNYKNFYRVP